LYRQILDAFDSSSEVLEIFPDATSGVLRWSLAGTTDGATAFCGQLAP
jgi:hypothetical protein